MSFIDVTMQLLDGFKVTMLIFFVVLLGALPLGLVITFGSMSKIKPLRWLTRTFVWIIRGTPLMLQIFAIFYLPGLLKLFVWLFIIWSHMMIKAGYKFSIYFMCEERKKCNEAFR